MPIDVNTNKYVDNHADSIRVYDRECNGCKRVKKDIMISILVYAGDISHFNDYFLTTEQAKALIVELEKKIKQNESLFSIMGRP